MFTMEGDPVAIDNTTTTFPLVGDDGERSSQFEAYCAAVANVTRITRQRTASRSRSESPEVSSQGGHASSPKSQSPHPAFERVRALFLNGQGVPGHAAYAPGLGYDIGEAGIEALEAGFLSFLETLASLGLPALEQTFRGLEADLVARLEWLGEPVAWKADVGRIDASFLTQVARVMMAV